MARPGARDANSWVFVWSSGRAALAAPLLPPPVTFSNPAGLPIQSADTKPAIVFRLRKHADYQRVYKASRKQFARQMSFFVAPRDTGAAARALDPDVPRVGLTVGKVMGKAVDRNRIKRRMREAVRANLPLLHAPVDLILHPRRSVIDLDFAGLKAEVAHVFRQVQRRAGKQTSPAIAPTPDQ